MVRTLNAAPSCTILVIDDEPPIARMIDLLLRKLGCQVLTAYDAESALQIISASTPDLVIADIRLPGIDGLEFTRRFKSRHADVPVLLISAYGEPDGHPADGFVAKPFDNEYLIETVQTLVDRQARDARPGALWYGGRWPGGFSA